MFIKQIVSKILAKKAEYLDGLRFLNEALMDNNFSSFEIFTLNHDIVSNRILNQKTLVITMVLEKLKKLEVSGILNC